MINHRRSEGELIRKAANSLNQLHLCHFGVNMYCVVLKVQFNTPFLHGSSSNNRFFT